MPDYKQPAPDGSDAANVAVAIVAFVAITVAMWVAEWSTPIGGVQGNPGRTELVHTHE